MFSFLFLRYLSSALLYINVQAIEFDFLHLNESNVLHIYAVVEMSTISSI